jgi:hypothetical protein
VILIEPDYIRKGVRNHGLWQEVRDKDGSQKESNKKEIRQALCQAGKKFTRRIFWVERLCLFSNAFQYYLTFS